ncbi:hypothetical protein HPP92_015214 [Vanilla planifolia]|uniref:Uncharacterized protein n=1 Tax=Vanilla planifolia TaxID=51239 RepID=A0A835QPQ5_VANPL|nr:hypothetical protein HPP92_015214 [Vanilla planifolia]
MHLPALPRHQALAGSLCGGGSGTSRCLPLKNKNRRVKADDDKQDDIEPPVQQSYGDGFDGNDDVQDIVMVEAQAPETVQARVAEANETNLDLSLGLKSHDGDHGTDSKPSV